MALVFVTIRVCDPLSFDERTALSFIGIGSLLRIPAFFLQTGCFPQEDINEKKPAQRKSI